MRVCVLAGCLCVFGKPEVGSGFFLLHRFFRGPLGIREVYRAVFLTHAPAHGDPPEKGLHEAALSAGLTVTMSGRKAAEVLGYRPNAGAEAGARGGGGPGSGLTDPAGRRRPGLVTRAEGVAHCRAWFSEAEAARRAARPAPLIRPILRGPDCAAVLRAVLGGGPSGR